MGFKSLFINDETDTTKPKATEVKKEVNKFPVLDSQVEDIFANKSSSAAFPTFPQGNTPVQSAPIVSNEHLAKFTEMYHNGFIGLNQPSYDFYEFYQAIMTSGGIDNPQMYAMAMTMGTSMDKNNSKDRLLTQADFYLNEINKVYNQYVTTGNSKRQDLVTQKANEAESLQNDLINLKGQLEAIANQIKSKESNLSLIDNKYGSLIGDIESKLKANEMAKESIASSIEKVKAGIANNIK